MMLNYIGNILFLYADPGSGLLILQLLLAGALGAAFYLRLYSKKVKSFLFRKGKDENASLKETSEKTVETAANRRSSDHSISKR